MMKKLILICLMFSTSIFANNSQFSEGDAIDLISRIKSYYDFYPPNGGSYFNKHKDSQDVTFDSEEIEQLGQWLSTAQFSNPGEFIDKSVKEFSAWILCSDEDNVDQQMLGQALSVSLASNPNSFAPGKMVQKLWKLIDDNGKGCADGTARILFTLSKIKNPEAKKALERFLSFYIKEGEYHRYIDNLAYIAVSALVARHIYFGEGYRFLRDFNVKTEWKGMGAKTIRPKYEEIQLFEYIGLALNDIDLQFSKDRELEAQQLYDQYNYSRWSSPTAGELLGDSGIALVNEIAAILVFVMAEAVIVPAVLITESLIATGVLKQEIKTLGSRCLRYLNRLFETKPAQQLVRKIEKQFVTYLDDSALGTGMSGEITNDAAKTIAKLKETIRRIDDNNACLRLPEIERYYEKERIDKIKEMIEQDMRAMIAMRRELGDLVGISNPRARELMDIIKLSENAQKTKALEMLNKLYPEFKGQFAYVHRITHKAIRGEIITKKIHLQNIIGRGIEGTLTRGEKYVLATGQEIVVTGDQIKIAREVSKLIAKSNNNKITYIDYEEALRMINSCKNFPEAKKEILLKELTLANLKYWAPEAFVKRFIL